MIHIVVLVVLKSLHCCSQSICSTSVLRVGITRCHSRKAGIDKLWLVRLYIPRQLLDTGPFYSKAFHVITVMFIIVLSTAIIAILYS